MDRLCLSVFHAFYNVHEKIMISLAMENGMACSLSDWSSGGSVSELL